jgi:LPS sulfotransferase NodH
VPSPRLRQVPRFAWNRSLRELNRVLAQIETRHWSRDEGPIEPAPIFVIGAPRSGSTLLYQLLVARFDVTYLSNLHCVWFGAPSVVEWAVGRRVRPPADFSSRFGHTHGRAGPSECGPYWYRFFRKSPQHVSLAEAEPQRLHRLRASVRALTEASGRTVVFKNLLNAVRLEPLATALPEAIFVAIHRHPEDNAASILAARRTIRGDVTKWWSTEPPGVERLSRLRADEQVSEQVRVIEELVGAARETSARDRLFDVRYEPLCADTHGTLDAIAAFAEVRGAALPVRRTVPERFGRGT